MAGAATVLPARYLRRPFGLSTFVTVGTAKRAYPRLLRAVVGLAESLPQPVIIQCGVTPVHRSNCVVVPFMQANDYERALAGSELVIAHGGGGAVILAMGSGHVPVMVPRLSILGEAIDDHQLTWGRMLASAGRVVLVEDIAKLNQAIAEARRRQLVPRARLSDAPLIAMVAAALKRR